MTGNGRPCLILNISPVPCVFEKGVAVVKGGPEDAVVLESQGSSALTRQAVLMACTVRS